GPFPPCRADLSWQDNPRCTSCGTRTRRACTTTTSADSRQPRRASGPAPGDHREIRLRPGSPAGHRDRVLIRRETARDADVIRAITTAAFAPSRPPGQTVPEARLID